MKQYWRHVLAVALSLGILALPSTAQKIAPRYIHFWNTPAANVATPGSNRYRLFVDAGTLKLKDSTGTSAAVGNATTVSNPTTTYGQKFEFTGAIPTSANGDVFPSTNGTGAAVTSVNSADPGGHPGVIQDETGTTTTGRATVTTNGNAFSFGSGVLVYECEFNIPTLSDGTETFTTRIGFSDLGSADPVDGAYIRYTHSVNSGKFECVTRSNNSETAIDSGVTVVAGTWYHVMIAVNAGATSVSYSINGTVPASSPITTNIPSGTARVTGLNTGIVKSAGTTSRVLQLDWIAWRFTPTSPLS